MATYAPVPAFAERKLYPRALFVIVAAHAAAIAAIMMVKMNLPARILPAPTEVELVPLPKEPPPNPAELTPGAGAWQIADRQADSSSADPAAEPTLG